MPDTLIASVLLEEQVDDSETVLPIKVDIFYENGQLFFRIPEVSTFSEYPGTAIPIILELANGKLNLRLYDDQGDDPALIVAWERALLSQAVLAAAKANWESEKEQDHIPVTPSTMSVDRR